MIGTWKTNTVTNSYGTCYGVYSFYENSTYILRYYNPTNGSEFHREFHEWTLADKKIVNEGGNLFWEISYNKKEKTITGKFNGFAESNTVFPLSLTKQAYDEYESPLTQDDFLGTWKTNTKTENSMLTGTSFSFYGTFKFEEANKLVVRYFDAADDTAYFAKKYQWHFSAQGIELSDNNGELFSKIIFNRSKSEFSGKTNRRRIDFVNLDEITKFTKQ